MAYDYGQNNYGGKIYGGHEQAFALSSIPVIVELYDNTLGRKNTFQTGVGDFLGCEFTLDKSGCKDFVLGFAGAVNIIKTDIVKIKLFNSIDNFFTGVIRKTPIDGSTEADYTYSGYGLNDYLVRLNAGSLSYSSKTITYILSDILDNTIVPNSPIVKNATKINVPDITLTSFDSNYSQIPDIIDTLLKIANSEGKYISGVDHDGEFFFKPKSAEEQVFLAVGKTGKYGIDRYEPEDTFEAKTRYYVLDKDGVYVTSVASTEGNDIFEQKLTAPDIDNTSIEKWADGILAENEKEKRRATIEWKIEEIDPLRLIADGTIRVLSNIPPEDNAALEENPYGSGVYGSGLYGGELSKWKILDDTLDIIEVTYTLNGNRSVRTIQLGSLPVRFDETINTLRKNLVDLRVSLGR